MGYCDYVNLSIAKRIIISANSSLPMMPAKSCSNDSNLQNNKIDQELKNTLYHASYWRSWSPKLHGSSEC
jgi:hypothetical protein